MVDRNGTKIVEFDAARAWERADELLGDQLLLCAVYTDEAYEILAVSDKLQASYGREQIEELGSRLHRYMDVDFVERELFTDLYPQVDETEALVTYTDATIVVRILSGREGLYLSITPDTEITPVVEELAPVVKT